jgi:glutamyl-tRNA synthetase
MAPSPTGFLHVGSLRTALFNFLFARKNNGTFIMRVEDTDKARTVPGALDEIVHTLSNFGLSPDEGMYWDAENRNVKEKGGFGPYLQSERQATYAQYAQLLIAKKAAYYCFCEPARLEQLRKEQEAKKLPPKYDKLCLNLTPQEIQQKFNDGEPSVIRLNVPADQRVRFTDLVHGEIEISTNDLDDQILLKSDGYPTYHLAVVVDDYMMKITHVIRGDEWIPSTPKHILLYAAFGWESPKFIHLPLLLSKSRKKLSKREGDVAVNQFLEQGYLPQALLNFVVFLGWNPKTEQEIFTLNEMIEQFSIEKINKAGAIFDLEKLDWINGLYIRKMDLPTLVEKAWPYLIQSGVLVGDYPKQFLEKIVALEQGRLKKLSEIGERIKYFFHEPQYYPGLLVWKKTSLETIKQNLEKLSQMINNLEPNAFNKEELEKRIKGWVSENKMIAGEVLWPLRVALTGQEASPGPFEIMDALASLPNGKEIILNRIKKATSLL